MRRALLALLLAVSLLAAPALAAAPAPAAPAVHPSITAQIGRDFVTGADFYFQTVGDWIDGLLNALGIKKRPLISGDQQPCDQSIRCAGGFVCRNVCADAACDSYDKRCVRGAASVQVLGEYAVCGGDDLCAEGSLCQRVCPPGLDCGGVTYRCMNPIAPTGTCAADAQCAAVCGQLPFEPIGSSGYVARCVQGACDCRAVQTAPSAPRVTCPSDVATVMSCPTGTQPGCTPGQSCASGNCATVATCLTSPEYGGQCVSDAECNTSICPEGAVPFCDPASVHCKCRAEQATTISCQSAADCASAGCTGGLVPACQDGTCGCTSPSPTSACKVDADCAACDAGTVSKCVQNACVCQKTSYVPTACATVDDCAAVPCPQGYDKSCRSGACACVRTPVQP